MPIKSQIHINVSKQNANADNSLTPQKKCYKAFGLCSVLRPRQHSIGYMGDGFYRSKDPTNSIKVLKEMLQREKQRTKTTKCYKA